MPKQFEVTVTLPEPPGKVHAVLVDEAYWRNRLRESPDAELRFDHSGGGLDVSVTETTDPSSFPPVARAVIKGPLRITRTDSWGQLVGERAEGAITGRSTGVPAEIDGTAALRPDGEGGSVMAVSGQVRVNVRLVGGQIEVLLKQMVANLIERDRDEIGAWLSR